MFAEPPPTKEDLKRAAIIRHKQQNENERKARIFNPRTRVIGLDCDGLAKQLAEKRERQERENEIEQRYRATDQKQYELIDNRANRFIRERHHIERELNVFRNQFQKKEFGSAFDLNDPDRNKHQNTDPWLIDAPIFQGEDVNYQERQRLQRAQQKAWLVQQMNEKQQKRTDANEEKRAIKESVDTINRRLCEMGDAEHNNRKNVYATTAEFNRALAEQQRKRREWDRQQEDNDNKAEIYNNLTSAILCERKDYASSQFGGQRRNVTMYRGLTDDELSKLWQDKKSQLEHQKKQREQEKEQEEQYERIDNEFKRMGLLKERDTKRELRNKAINYSHENQKLSKEQTARKQYFELVENTNQPTEKYFEQFNTTSR